MSTAMASRNCPSFWAPYCNIIFVAEPTFGRFVTLQRLSSRKLEQLYYINWREVIVHHEGISEGGDTATVKIAVDKAKKIKI